MSYVPLRNYTQYSITDSILTLDPWLSWMSDEGVMAVGCCDKNNFFGLVRFYQKALKNRLKPLIGAELLYHWHPKFRPSPVIFYARNYQGYQNISKLMTLLYQQESAPILTPALLKGHTTGLLAIIPPESFQAFKEQEHLFCALFDEQCLVGIERYPSDLKSQTQSLEILSWCSEKNYPPVALNAVYFLKPQDYQTQQIKSCIQKSHYLQDQNRPIEQKPYHHAYSCEQMRQLFDDCPQALDNTILVAKKCTLSFEWGKVLLPQFSEDEVRTLRDAAHQGLQERLDKGQISADNKQQYESRLDIELKVITQMGFSGYFLIVADFIQWAKNHQILVGPGRGSGAGSLVAYALKITDIDPLPYGLLFERFLNPERVSMPDFDIDFCMIGRDRVIEYVQQRYGRDHVSQIATFGTMAAKAVIRDVGRVHSLPFPFVDKIAKMIPLQIGITLEEALAQNPELTHAYETDEQVHELIDYARKLEGLPRNVGRHAGGVIIAPRPLYDICPLYSEEPTPWHPVSHLDKDDIEQLGLIKFDFLGLKTLTIIDWTYQKAAAIGLELCPLEKIPLDDPDSYALLNTGCSTAVFQLESKSMRDLIIRLQPDCFEDIIAIVALNRPGPLQSGMVDDFIERKHGRQDLSYPHPWTEPILKETYGVILYQEQVMQLAQTLAGYTLGGADLLRRAMGKKKPEEMAKQRDIFLKGATELGIESDVAHGIFDLMEKFAGYGFNKSHSAAYALIVFQTLYLKTHAPAPFMAATMTADHGNFDKIALFTHDLPALGLALKPPCVQYSKSQFEAEDSKTIRYGLCGIKGFGEGIAESLVAERLKHGAFSSWSNFLERALKAGLSQKAIELLIKAGACDCFYTNRRLMLEVLLPQNLAAAQTKNAGQKSLFDLEESEEHASYASNNTSNMPIVPDFQWSWRLQTEISLLGVPISGGIFDPYAWVQSPLWVLTPQEASFDKPCLLLYQSCRVITTQKGQRLLIAQFLQKGDKNFEVILQLDQREQDKALCQILTTLKPYTPLLAGLTFSASKHNREKIYTSLVAITFFDEFFSNAALQWRWRVLEPSDHILGTFISDLIQEEHRPTMVFDIGEEAVLLRYTVPQAGPKGCLEQETILRWIEQGYTHHKILHLEIVHSSDGLNRPE